MILFNVTINTPYANLLSGFVYSYVFFSLFMQMSISGAKKVKIMDKESTSDSVEVQSITYLKTISSEERHSISPFGKPNVILTVENVEFHLQKEHLIAESPVFEKMLKSDLTDLEIRQIPLPGKTIYPFVDFLRFLTPGINNELNGNTNM
jgi:hypothetical protein